MRPNRPAAGFTLIELLVVIGIIALLISILLPVLNRARVSGVDVACRAQLRELGGLQSLYAIDYLSLTPAERAQAQREQWMFLLYPYVEPDFDAVADLLDEAPEPFWCPAEPRDADQQAFDRFYSYGLNSFIQAPPWNDKPSIRGASASELILMADKTPGGYPGARQFVHTEEGFIYEEPSFAGIGGQYFKSQATQHSSFGAYRHVHTKGDRDAYQDALAGGTVKPTFDIFGTNALFLDGHVEPLLRSQMLLDSPLWHPDRGFLKGLVLFGTFDQPCCN